tara:strand:- start:3120 stop:3410 length:291 start_codon:yes stop_codon:yes gene_type:complete
MKRPTKTAFYEHMKEKYGEDFKGHQLKNDLYFRLLEAMTDAEASDNNLMALANLTIMNKVDRAIFRNEMAEKGKEMTPLQVVMYLATIEYALEHVS